MREGVWLPPLSRLDHLPLFLSLAAGYCILFDLEGYTFGDEKSFSLSGDVKRKTRKVKRARGVGLTRRGMIRQRRVSLWRCLRRCRMRRSRLLGPILAEEARTGVLLTLRNGRPFGSHVPYVFGERWTRAYIHVSRLALHTEHLLHDPRVGLFVSEPDRSGKNPLVLRRMNLQGEAALLDAGAPDYAEVKNRYLARFPQSAMMFGFADFSLWELRLQDAHLILGFGQAYLADATTPLTWIHQKPSTKGVTRET